MRYKNQLVLPLLTFVIITIVWYFVLDSIMRVSTDICARVDCLPLGDRMWPMLFGSGCCGSLTTFREFAHQLLLLLAPGVILAGAMFVVLTIARIRDDRR